jgi:putative flippase GtrA
MPETKRSITRFLKYASIGVSTFLLDLGMLYVFTEFLHVHYLIASGVAFVIAVSINFLFSRHFVFKGSERSMKAGYVIFLMIAGTGLLLVVGLMHVLVGILGFPVLVSRVGVAGVVGVWNYLMNLFVNFKVAGKTVVKEIETLV